MGKASPTTAACGDEGKRESEAGHNDERHPWIVHCRRLAASMRGARDNAKWLFWAKAQRGGTGAHRVGYLYSSRTIDGMSRFGIANEPNAPPGG
jgi:hypothetical protein